MLQGLAINDQLAHFADGHLQVLMMSWVGFFFLKRVQVARHPGQATKQAGLALGGRVRGPCSFGHPPGLAHLQKKAIKTYADVLASLASAQNSSQTLPCSLGVKWFMKHCDVLCLLECLTSTGHTITAVLTPALTKQRLSWAVHTLVHKLHTTPIQLYSQLPDAALNTSPGHRLNRIPADG